MALIAQVEVDGTGLMATYCRITSVAVDFTSTREIDGQTITGSAEVIVHAYADAEARASGKGPAALRRLLFTSADFPLEGLSRAGLYDAIKSTPDFSGAKDA